jgi:asparagine synthase (glutamine-hydrolysing)
VRLTGVFGGEILRGVSMFKPVCLARGFVDADLAEAVTSCARRWSRDDEHPVTFTAFREAPELRFALVAASRSQVTFRTPYLDNEIVALAYRAPETARSSACALSLVKANNPSLSKVRTDMGELGEANGLTVALRHILTRIACQLDYYRSEGLPRSLSRFDSLLIQLTSVLGISGLHKYLPYRIWFKRQLADYVKRVASDSRTHQASLWNGRFLGKMVTSHIDGRDNYIHEINVMLTLEAVERLLFRVSPNSPTVSAVTNGITATQKSV